MITNFEDKVRMVFGTGDIGFNAGSYIENGKNVGLVIFYNQEAREIGDIADIKAGTPVNFEDFPVAMEFHKIESIAILIEQLVVARNEMEARKMPYLKIKFEVIKDIYWDNWGKSVKAFSKGQVCEGQLYPDGSIVAESPYYTGVSDLVDSTCVKQVFFTKVNVPGEKGHE